MPLADGEMSLWTEFLRSFFPDAQGASFVSLSRGLQPDGSRGIADL
jgi:hypothetical protein